jgi:gas vesicle protein
MKQLFLDTNIIYQEGFFSGNMQIIARLIKSKDLTIHISEISKREFISKCISENTENLHQSIKQIKSKFVGSCLEKYQVEIKQIVKNVEEQIKLSFNSWKEELNVAIMDFNFKDITKVMDDYFTGNGIFLEAKNRNDIPDAMINTSIYELLNKYKDLVVVTKDNRFKKALEKNSQINMFDCLSDFLQSYDIKQKLKALDYIENKSVEEIKNYFFGSKFRSFLIQYLIKSKEIIEDICLGEEEISSINKLKLPDSWGFRLESPMIDKIKNVHVLEVFMLSKNKYTIKLEFETIASVSFCDGNGCFYTDNWDDYVCYSRKLDLISQKGDGATKLSENWHVKLYGEIQIQIKNEFCCDSFKNHCIESNPIGTPFTLSLEINKADLEYWCR